MFWPGDFGSKKWHWLFRRVLLHTIYELRFPKICKVLQVPNSKPFELLCCRYKMNRLSRSLQVQKSKIIDFTMLEIDLCPMQYGGYILNLETWSAYYNAISTITWYQVIVNGSKWCQSSVIFCHRTPCFGSMDKTSVLSCYLLQVH